MPDKPKVAFYWCASCGGCEETVVDLAEEDRQVVDRLGEALERQVREARRADVRAHLLHRSRRRDQLLLVGQAGRPGLLGRHALVDMSESFFHDVINVNVLTTFLCSKAVAPGCGRWR